MSKAIMSGQKQKHSLFEAVTGTIIGLISSFAIQLVLYPLLGIKVSIGENVIISAVFFAVSIIRGYFLRRLFNKII